MELGFKLAFSAICSAEHVHVGTFAGGRNGIEPEKRTNPVVNLTEVHSCKRRVVIVYSGG